MQVVVAATEWHGQSIVSQEYDDTLSGEMQRPLSDAARESLLMGPRKVIAHRCKLAFERPHSILNVGVGMPEVLSPCQLFQIQGRAS